MNYLENACEEIDAGIFSGDLLWIEERREMLKRYMARWQRAIDEHGDENYTEFSQ
jgi:hypothetical protein